MIPPALRLLIRLRFFATLRSLKKFLSTIRGKIVAVAFAGICLLILATTLVQIGDQSPHQPYFDTETLQKQTTLGFFLMLFFIFIKSKKNGIVFTPDEVEHLFSAPFTRRQLLIFKLISGIFPIIVSTCFCCVAYSRFAPNFALATLGMLLSLTFLNYVSILFGLFGQVSVKIAARNQRVALGLIMILVLLASPFAVAFAKGSEIEFPENLSAFSTQITDSTAGRMILAPISVFTHIIFWNESSFALAGWIILAIAEITLVVIGILALDVNFLELNASESQRLHKKIEDSKRMGIVITRKEFKRSIPRLPFWHGLGPIIWRQLLESYRYSMNILPIAGVIVLFVCGASWFNSRSALPLDFRDESIRSTLGFAAGVSAGMTTLIFVLLAPVGFRSDVERMDILKALPFKNWVIVVGQFIGASLILSTVQAFIGLVFVAFTQEWIWLLSIPATLPVNYLLFAVSGMILLWYPIRPSDNGVAAMGGNLITVISLYVAMIIVVIFLGIPVGLVYAFSESIAASISVAFFLSIFLCAGTTSMAVIAYKKFDVSMDTPK